MYCTNFVWHNDKAKEIAIFEFFINAIFFFVDFGLGSLGGGLGGPPGPILGTPPSSSQPLPSNMMSKQQSNMDQQYLQQSSQGHKHISNLNTLARKFWEFVMNQKKFTRLLATDY